jgi:hypothetical protein
MVQSLATGYIDVWWLNALGQYWWVLAWSLVAFPIVVLFVLDRRLKLKDEEGRSGPKENPPKIVPAPMVGTKS